MSSDPSGPRSATGCDGVTTLAHLSDPHLPPPPVRWHEALNKRALSLISWKYRRRHLHLAQTCDAIMNDIASQHVDAILVSGDLTNFGTADEFAAAARWLEKMSAPVMVIPGNHDRMVPQSRKAGAFLWKRWGGGIFPYVRIHDGVAVVGVSSAIATPPFMAYGHVDRAQRRRLERLLTKLGTLGYCRVVMIHHPPRRGLVRLRKALIGMNAMVELLRRSGAEIVLHGHSHDSTLATIAGTDIPLLGVASASLAEDRPHRRASWNRLRIARHEKGWEITLQRRRDDGVVTECAGWIRPGGAPAAPAAPPAAPRAAPRAGRHTP